MMSVKRYKVVLPSSSQRIRQAKESLRRMTQLRRIELMVKAGAMTEVQAQKARAKLGEVKIVE
jgi:hypothetical protein